MKSWIFVIRTFPPFLIPAQRHTPSFSANSPCVPSVKSCVLSNCAFHEKVLFRHLYCGKNEGILLTVFCNFPLPALIAPMWRKGPAGNRIKREAPPYCGPFRCFGHCPASRFRKYPQWHIMRSVLKPNRHFHIKVVQLSAQRGSSYMSTIDAALLGGSIHK